MDLFKNLKQQIKIREVSVDDEVFQLHYRVTAILLFGCAALVASKQHFGDPIDCMTRDDVPSKIMDTYCWIHSTFTLPDACNKTVGIEVAHPCVDKNGMDRPDERVYHKYYQWVYFVLFFQALAFYAPHYIWKTNESKLMSKLAGDLKSPISKGNCKCNQIANYLVTTKFRHERYFRIYALCESLNFLNVLLQIYVVDKFLGGTFTTYGLDVLKYSQMDQEDRADPMARVFPKMTKCTFHRFGSSGDVQRHDSLCILPLNILNEKIYIIMWFWFVFLAIVTGCWLLYRLLTMMRPKLRYRSLARKGSLAIPGQVEYVLSETGPGDWFLLYMICRNVDARWFRVIIAATKRRLALKHKKPKEDTDDKRISEESFSEDSPGSDSEDDLDSYDNQDDNDDLPLRSVRVSPSSKSHALPKQSEV